jgi:hypothetical protein
MPAKKQEQSAPFHLIACAVLAMSPMFGAAGSVAAESQLRLSAPFTLPPPIITGETRVPATRPAASAPTQMNYMAGNVEIAEPRGRLRLRPMTLGGN